jgi:hypothetical protein
MTAYLISLALAGLVAIAVWGRVFVSAEIIDVRPDELNFAFAET